MRTAIRLAAYGSALALVLAGAYAVGTAVSPPGAGAAPALAEPGDGHGGSHGTGHAPGGSQVAGAERAEPGGLTSSSRGYTFTPTDSGPTDGAFSFAITGSDGRAVTAFDLEHDERMHLVVVRRDTTGYQHVHPRMGPDGTWTVPLALPAAGSYRAFADFTPTGGPALTLGTDLAVPGSFAPVTHEPSRTAVIDGYEVSLAGELTAGQASPLTLTVRRDGQPVTDLQPHLASYGHLVVLREGDLQYLHVHPDGAPGDGRTPAGPQIRFVAEVPDRGDHRLFLDFRHADVVRTAEFTLAASEAGPS